MQMRDKEPPLPPVLLPHSLLQLPVCAKMWTQLSVCCSTERFHGWVESKKVNAAAFPQHHLHTGTLVGKTVLYVGWSGCLGAQCIEVGVQAALTLSPEHSCCVTEDCWLEGYVREGNINYHLLSCRLHYINILYGTFQITSNKLSYILWVSYSISYMYRTRTIYRWYVRMLLLHMVTYISLCTSAGNSMVWRQDSSPLDSVAFSSELRLGWRPKIPGSSTTGRFSILLQHSE